jgi:hypothetical protein
VVVAASFSFLNSRPLLQIEDRERNHEGIYEHEYEYEYE